MSHLHYALPLVLAASILGGCAPALERPAPEPSPAPVADLSGATAPAAVSSDTPRATEAKSRDLTIRLGHQRFIYREDGQVVRTGPVSSGRAGYPTPRGRFSVLSKHKDKVSYRYTNQLGWPAWMPYSIQFSGHYFLHEGWLPGYPDSHGCVRVGEKDARFLYQRLRIGDRIAVVD
jgi:lipoprotein-anchoring transpeptidase ErfK/SrfK